ncbi:hypothetical protein SKAU_G00281880 [Synaphobranchus kaupii]|uniref:Uncharacterized protein n=1 Tax=Synaphobranchus kaupii TaxID=118154 RepID=A0A9Q1EX87_SYNKA|nr:hypothetical protein SKAU_G00281880 [Synaphobranchus kaupii]
MLSNKTRMQSRQTRPPLVPHELPRLLPLWRQNAGLQPGGALGVSCGLGVRAARRGDRDTVGGEMPPLSHRVSNQIPRPWRLLSASLETWIRGPESPQGFPPAAPQRSSDLLRRGRRHALVSGSSLLLMPEAIRHTWAMWGIQLSVMHVLPGARTRVTDTVYYCYIQPARLQFGI